MENLDYIHSLMASSGRQLTQSKIAELISLTDKKDINKAFFELPLEELEKGLAERKVPPSELYLLSSAVNAAIKAKARERISELEKDAEHFRQVALVRFSDGEHQLQNATKMINEALALKEGPPMDLDSIMEKILQNPFYNFLEASVANMQLVFTTNNVVLRYKNEDHEVDQTVNFGKFRVVWEIKTNRIWLAPHENNIKISGYLHPHASSSSICWGNAKDAMSKALLRYDMATVFTLLQTILHQYNPDSPYINLYHFWLRQNVDKIPDHEITWRDHGHVWIFKDRIDHEINYEESEVVEIDGNDTEIILIPFYKRTHEGANFVVDQQKHYKTRNGRYIALKDEAIYDDEVNFQSSNP